MKNKLLKKAKDYLNEGIKIVDNEDAPQTLLDLLEDKHEQPVEIKPEEKAVESKENVRHAFDIIPIPNSMAYQLISIKYDINNKKLLDINTETVYPHKMSALSKIGEVFKYKIISKGDIKEVK